MKGIEGATFGSRDDGAKLGLRWIWFRRYWGMYGREEEEDQINF
jgi:hypothetical protein